MSRREQIIELLERKKGRVELLEKMRARLHKVETWINAQINDAHIGHEKALVELGIVGHYFGEIEEGEIDHSFRFSDNEVVVIRSKVVPSWAEQ